MRRGHEQGSGEYLCATRLHPHVEPSRNHNYAYSNGYTDGYAYQYAYQYAYGDTYANKYQYANTYTYTDARLVSTRAAER